MSHVLNYPYSGIPSPAMQALLAEIEVPEHFVGRVGCMIVDVAGTHHVHLSFQPIDVSIRDYRLLPAPLVPMRELDCPAVTLTNMLGESIALKDFFLLLFRNYPEKPLMQGGYELEQRKALWRAAMVAALKSPCIDLLLRHARREFSGTPIALNELWFGPSPAGEIRFNRSFISPLTITKPLFDWISQGLNIESAHGLWPQHMTPELPVLYENRDVIIINKPAKLASVPGIKETANAKDVLENNLGSPLYVVHRLDTDTSGVLLFAKTKQALAELNDAFRSKLAFKRYRALLDGTVKSQRGRIDLPLATNFLDSPRQWVVLPQLGGKHSVTDFEIISTQQAQDGIKTLVDLYPETGRTHQLRIHCAHAQGLGAPIVNDPFYGRKALLCDGFDTKLHLHAAEMTVTNPHSGVVIHAACDAPF